LKQFCWQRVSETEMNNKYTKNRQITNYANELTRQTREEWDQVKIFPNCTESYRNKSFEGP